MEKKKSSKKWMIYVGIVVVVVAGVAIFISSRNLTGASAAAQSQYQTTTAAKGDLTAYIGATGSVSSNQTAILAWQTAGIVSSVNVTKGQVIPAHTLLAELDETTLPQSVIMAQSDLVTAQKALDDLVNGTTARANAQLALVNAQKALDDAQKNRQSKQFQRASQQTIDIARANEIQAKSALEDAETKYNQVKNRNTDDVVYAAALSQLAAAQQKYNQAVYNLKYVQDLPSPLEIQQSDANVAVAQANLLSAQRDWERVKDGPNDQDVAAAQAKVDAIEATLNMANITNPFEGTVTVLDTKVGDQVTAGTKAFEIDDLSHLYVDVDVAEVDIASIQIGQPVTLTFDSIQGKEFQGTVSDIASIGTTTSGVVNFTVTVEITDDTSDIKPGMTAAANITVSQLHDVLLVPNRAIRTQNGTRIVYVLKNGVPTPIEITLGASSNTESEITGGDLKVGDQVVLNPPSTIDLGPNSGGSTFGG